MNLEDLLSHPVFSFSSTTLTLGQLVLVPTFLLLGYFVLKTLIRITDKNLQKRNVNADLTQVIRRGMYILGLIVLFITLLDLLNVPLTAFAFVSGAVAIGFGFGAQNIINNFISGWILMWERPIRINDFIEIDGTFGTVEEINTRSTRIRRVDGVHLLIPNSKLLEETVVNWTLMDKLLRTQVRVGVAYGTDVTKVRDELMGVLKNNEGILIEPKPQVIFEDFGDSSLVFDCYFWVNAQAERSAREIRSDVRFEIEEVFAENEIVIAFSQRDIHVDGTLNIQNS